MATQPPPESPTPPDSPPVEEPVRVPDEIAPGGGDYDQPDSTPVEDPGSPGKSAF